MHDKPSRPHGPQPSDIVISPEERAEARAGIEAIIADGGPEVVDRLVEVSLNSYRRFGLNGYAAGRRAGVAMFCGKVEDMPDGKVLLGNIDLTKIATEVLRAAGFDRASGSQLHLVALGLRQAMSLRRDIICGALADEQARLARLAQSFPYLIESVRAADATISTCIEIARTLLPAELVPVPGDGDEDDAPTGSANAKDLEAAVARARTRAVPR